jgi:hypothetical protein
MGGAGYLSQLYSRQTSLLLIHVDDGGSELSKQKRQPRNIKLRDVGVSPYCMKKNCRHFYTR